MAVALHTKSGHVQTMVNRSSLSPAEADKQLKRDPGLKILADPTVQQLLDALGGNRFFDMADSGDPPAGYTAMQVLHNGKTYSTSSRQTNRDDLARWAQWVQLFQDTYNSTDQFRSSSLDSRTLYESRDQLERDYQKRTNKQ